MLEEIVKAEGLAKGELHGNEAVIKFWKSQASWLDPVAVKERLGSLAIRECYASTPYMRFAVERGPLTPQPVDLI